MAKAPRTEAPFGEKVACYRGQHMSKGALVHLVGTPIIAAGLG